MVSLNRFVMDFGPVSVLLLEKLGVEYLPHGSPVFPANTYVPLIYLHVILISITTLIFLPSPPKPTLSTLSLHSSVYLTTMCAISTSHPHSHPQQAPRRQQNVIRVLAFPRQLRDAHTDGA
jgi:hypothetical protein